ncbi:hypothetical protein SAMN04488020_10755 [Palleronia marisminoris]|uniref:Uncharacterized protein n=1 Tax=Palleronia marisminoris TaxID=315423 RepID=A0A1Y5T246_9RHOB|nr:hypothetical protein [Palleronia marisminoris]SFH13714.1 hypothetical protein SAMN04488020_10755 [Palleronia marisminoris]SLN53692.1 hypothetical protein PAM7066_02527 [Palleronia marisminoris]
MRIEDDGAEAAQRGQLLAWGATIAWLAISALVLFGFTGGEADLDPLRVLMVPVAVLGPIALIWLATILARRLDALTRAVANGQAAPDLAALEKKLDAVLATRPRAQVAMPAPQQPARAAAPQQRALALEPAEKSPEPELTVDELIIALHFPQDAHDQVGFRALRRALRDRQSKVVVTAAQDLLTLLSQEGLYMDDLTVEPARPELWRRFAHGERGAPVGAVGGVRDDDMIALVTQRLRADTIFRDVALHFLRVFDQLLAKLEPHLSDSEIVELADTRTARSFMLVGRAMGTFD